MRMMVIVCALFVMVISGWKVADSPAQDGPIDFRKVFDSDRISEGSYRLILYNQKDNDLSNIGILDRSIVREVYNNVPSIKITETSFRGTSKNKAVLYVRAKELTPEYIEVSSNDTVIQRAKFTDGKMVIEDLVNGSIKRTEADRSPQAFLSNCFSELVQANDFGKTPAIQFDTFSPGRPANRFIVERVGEEEFPVAGKNTISCWILKFTRVDANQQELPAGFRYVEKASGKVLMFKTVVDSPNFFTYQMLFLP